MSEENLEDWDTDFLEEAIKVEEQHLSSQYIPTTTTSFDKPPRFEQSSSAAFVRNDIMSYSPPRELSQTTAAYSMPILDRASNGIGLHSSPLRRSDNTKDREIERLKKELGRVSKQLTELEHECFELRKGRDKEQHKKSILFKNNEQDGNAENSKKANMECAPTAVHEKLQLECQNVKGYDKLQQECPNLKGSDNQLCTWIHKDNSSCQEIGVQTDLPVRLDLSTKLQGIWSLIRDQNTGRTLISKLLVDCPTDFNILFGYARLSTSLKAVDTLAVENSLEKEHASEAAKASNFFCVVMKISNGMLQLEAMLEPLLDLCNANNDVIVHKSLCILHKLLNNLLALERRSEVSELYSGTMSLLRNFTP